MRGAPPGGGNKRRSRRRHPLRRFGTRSDGAVAPRRRWPRGLSFQRRADRSPMRLAGLDRASRTAARARRRLPAPASPAWLGSRACAPVPLRRQRPRATHRLVPILCDFRRATPPVPRSKRERRAGRAVHWRMNPNPARSGTFSLKLEPGTLRGRSFAPRIFRGELAPLLLVVSGRHVELRLVEPRVVREIDAWITGLRLVREEPSVRLVIDGKPRRQHAAIPV